MYVQRTEVVTIAQVAREMTGRNIDILGINETHWTGQGKMQLTEGETIIYSGRDDDNNRGVGQEVQQKPLWTGLQSVKGSLRHGSIPNKSS